MHQFLEATDISVEEIRNHPERLVNLILASDDQSLMVERHADMIRVTFLKSYDQKTRRIVAETRQAYVARSTVGYSREQAFQDLLQAKQEITEQLSDTDPT